MVCNQRRTEAGREMAFESPLNEKQGFPLCTIYTNLGEEAVVHGIKQTESTHVITTHDLLPKFKGILQKTPTVTHVIYFEDQVGVCKNDIPGFRVK